MSSDLNLALSIARMRLLNMRRHTKKRWRKEVQDIGWDLHDAIVFLKEEVDELKCDRATPDTTLEGECAQGRENKPWPSDGSWMPYPGCAPTYGTDVLVWVQPSYDTCGWASIGRWMNGWYLFGNCGWGPQESGRRVVAWQYFDNYKGENVSE